VQFELQELIIYGWKMKHIKREEDKKMKRQFEKWEKKDSYRQFLKLKKKSKKLNLILLIRAHLGYI